MGKAKRAERAVVPCAECGKRPMERFFARKCGRCYRRSYMRDWRARPDNSLRGKQRRKRAGNPICRCGCGKRTLRQRDSLCPGHRPLCRCGCGERVQNRYYRPGHASRGKKVIHSAEARQKMSLARKGRPLSENHRAAISQALRRKGGTLKDGHRTLRRSPAYRAWREAVFTRDHYTCQICGARNGSGKEVYLEADHLVPLVLRLDLAFVVANGRTLCRPCHRTTDTWGEKVKHQKGYSRKQALQMPLEAVLP